MIEFLFFMVNNKFRFHNAIGRFNAGVLVLAIKDTRHLTRKKCELNIVRFVRKSNIVNNLSLLMSEVGDVVARLKANNRNHGDKKR